MCAKDEEGLANSTDPDQEQTVRSGSTFAVWSGSTFSAQTCQSKYLIRIITIQRFHTQISYFKSCKLTNLKSMTFPIFFNFFKFILPLLTVEKRAVNFWGLGSFFSDSFKVKDWVPAAPNKSSWFSSPERKCIESSNEKNSLWNCEIW